jgi:hypothetical protein
MTLLNAAAIGATGLVAGMSFAEHAPVERSSWRKIAGVAAAGLAIAAALTGWRSRARAPLVASAALAIARSAAGAERLPLPLRRNEVVSGETKLIRLYRRDARLAGIRSLLEAATLGSLLVASARS